MEPLNSNERTTATLKVAGLFLITFIVLVIAVFFGVKLPTYQNEQLTAENDKLRQNKQLIDKAIVSMDSLNNYLTRYKKDSAGIGVLDNQIPKETANLLDYSNQDSIVGPVISRSISAYTVAWTGLKDLKKLGSAGTTITTLQNELNEKTAKLNTCEGELTDLRLKVKMSTSN